jgi:hypothetical protein
MRRRGFGFLRAVLPRAFAAIALRRALYAPAEYCV